MIQFRIAQHSSSPTRELVEVLVDGEVAAVIYPGLEKDTVRIISAHFKGVGTPRSFKEFVRMDDGVGTYPPIPVIEVDLEPGPYTIQDGKITKPSPN